MSVSSQINAFFLYFVFQGQWKFQHSKYISEWFAQQKKILLLSSMMNYYQEIDVWACQGMCSYVG